MEQDISTTYKSNYTFGIVFTIVALLSVVVGIISLMLPSIQCLGSIFNLLSAVLFFIWFYRSHKNLLAYNTQGLKYSAAWAVIAFFVPILNLFRPYQIGQEIWKASDPDASTVGWKQSKIGIVVIFWWISMLVRLPLMIWIFVYSFSSSFQAGLNGLQPDPNAILNTTSIPAVIVDAIYCILAISMVVLVNDRQDEKADNLGIL